MSDIVERLRGSVNNPHLYWQGEAADEIERLRQRVNELEAANDQHNRLHHAHSIGYRKLAAELTELRKAQGGQA